MSSKRSSRSIVRRVADLVQSALKIPLSSPFGKGGKRSKVRAQANEAAAAGRRLRLWQPSAYGPNSAVLGDLTLLRTRSRDLVRNNPWISRGVNSFVANEIGCGITFKAQSSDAAFNEAADTLWERQIQYFDVDGRMDFNGMLAQIVRTRREAGEIFIRRRLRRPEDGLPLPLQYQLLEPEFCPHTQNVAVSPFPGRTVKAGIEFDPIGRRTAYYMYRTHPNDIFFTSQAIDLNLVGIPASEIIHHYALLRPGQIRGIPAIVQAMIKAKEFDEFDDAELVRKKIKAAYTGVLRRQAFDENDWKYDPFTGEVLERDDAGVGIQNIEGGSMIQLLPGEDVTMFEGDTGDGPAYQAFIRQQLLGIGAGQDVPYEFLTGDFSQLNDRTLRVVLAEYHRTLEQDRWQLTIPQVCYPVWRDFIDVAIVAGALPEPADYATNREDYLKVACHPEGWPYLHELQDANADVVRLKAGLTSRKRILGEEGDDVREIDQERAEDAARSAKLGLSEDFGGGNVAPAPADPNQPSAPPAN